MEPASVLIAAFEIQDRYSFVVLKGGVGRLEIRVGLGHGKPAGTGVEPDVEDVVFLTEALAGRADFSTILANGIVW